MMRSGACRHSFWKSLTTMNRRQMKFYGSSRRMHGFVRLRSSCRTSSEICPMEIGVRRCCLRALPALIAERRVRSQDSRRMQRQRRCSRSNPRHARGAYLAGLGGETDRGIRRAKALITAALDDLEEEAFVEDVGVDLEELAVALAVVEDLVLA